MSGETRMEAAGTAEVLVSERASAGVTTAGIRGLMVAM